MGANFENDNETKIVMGSYDLKGSLAENNMDSKDNIFQHFPHL